MLIQVMVDSIFIWRYKAVTGARILVFTESTLYKMDYLTILKENVISSVEKLDLDHPRQSRDLNPIGYLWYRERQKK